MGNIKNMKDNCRMTKYAYIHNHEIIQNTENSSLYEAGQCDVMLNSVRMTQAYAYSTLRSVSTSSVKFRSCDTNAA